MCTSPPRRRSCRGTNWTCTKGGQECKEPRCSAPIRGSHDRSSPHRANFSSICCHIQQHLMFLIPSLLTIRVSVVLLQCHDASFTSWFINTQILVFLCWISLPRSVAAHRLLLFSRSQTIYLCCLSPVYFYAYLEKEGSYITRMLYLYVGLLSSPHLINPEGCLADFPHLLSPASPPSREFGNAVWFLSRPGCDFNKLNTMHDHKCAHLKVKGKAFSQNKGKKCLSRAAPRSSSSRFLCYQTAQGYRRHSESNTVHSFVSRICVCVCEGQGLS